MMDGVAAAPHMRVDKWLWHARFFKSRSIAAQAVRDGRVRINGRKLTRPNAAIRAGDVVTLIHGPRITLLRCAALGERRGPAPEAALLYEILERS